MALRTMEAMELHCIFKKMYDAGCEYVIMETSSHALDLDRCMGLKFDVGVFTNLTQDHLNYHATMEDYASAKAKLFHQIPREIRGIFICPNHPCTSYVTRLA